ncbi:22761_t:CDS:2 [Entrophospora sp. SA101]|nr:4954_t:CDS:2 [Entrophospora sp. SA101]CAJ0750358.1 22761_t:CDS:2 [Entrophospora sp. SA101]
MATPRPVSEQYNLQTQTQQKSGSNPQYRMSADLSHLGGQQATNHRGSRPTSEVFPTNNHNSYQSPEAEAIDKWFEDLQHYEQTLEEMATASLDETFKEELKAIEQWFRVLSEAERTAALFSLLQHSTQVQIRFFITVLQQMARNDPMGALLSPANPEKDLMQAQLSGAIKTEAMSLKSPTSQTYPRRLYDRHSGVDFLSPEAAIYTDPAVALAQKRARLQANTGNRSATLFQTRPKSMISETDPSLWNSSVAQTPTTANSDRTTNGRPKSADLSAWTPSYSIHSPRPGAFDAELSPLVGGSWASMVPTPVVPMFAENKNKQAADAELVNKKLANWNLSNSSGNRIVLESDVKKSPQQSPMPSPNIVGSRQGSRPPSPNHHHNNQYQAHHGGWSASNGKGGSGTHLAPPPNLVRVGSDENNGYHSDHSDASHNAGNNNNKPKGHGKAKKKQTDDTVFEGMKWQDIIELDDPTLEQKGVAALGARRKMIKEFDKVKEAMKENGLSAAPSS